MNELLQLDRAPLFVIAGPCVIESTELCLEVGAHVKRTCDRLGLTYIFKASFDKANRSSNSTFRGPGLTEGLVVLERVRRELGVPVLTDVHESSQATIAAKVVDVLQVPAFLARQTDLLVACGRTGRAVNVKKGQFMSPQEMRLAIEKVRAGQTEGAPCRTESATSASAQPRSDLTENRDRYDFSLTENRDMNENRDWYDFSSSASSLNPGPRILNPVLLTERGTFFGYNRLVNDFTAIPIMRSFGVPVVFDITHSTQQPAGLGESSGGNPQFSPMLARAAVAAGADGLFLECHPDPSSAKSDASTMLRLDEVEPLLAQCRQIAELRQSWR